jgi:hypothetical protein
MDQTGEQGLLIREGSRAVAEKPQHVPRLLEGIRN